MYQMVKTNVIIYLTRFNRIHERDRHPDRQTDGQTSHKGSVCTYLWHCVAKTVIVTHVVYAQQIRSIRT